MTPEQFHHHWRALEDAGKRFGSDLPPQPLPPHSPLLRLSGNMRSLLFVTISAVMGPVSGFLMLMAYLDSALDLRINPSVVFGGVVIVALSAIYILKWAADKFFRIIDGYPALVANVDNIQKDVAEIKRTVVKSSEADEHRDERERSIDKRVSKIETKLGII